MSTIENTELLNHKIYKSKNIKDFLNQNHDEIRTINFHHCLYKYIEEKGLKNSEFFNQAGLTESYGYQILNGKRQPSRDKVLQVCIGLSISVNDANRLLKLAEKSELYVRNKRDAIVMFSLNNNLNHIEVNELLFDEGCDLLD